VTEPQAVGAVGVLGAKACAARPRVAGIVLAAGRSERFGQPKVVYAVEGIPMVCRVADALAAGGCNPIIVVAGPDDGAVRGALAALPVRVVRNADAGRGIGTSVAAGARACPSDVDAIAVAVADQPWLSAELVQRLIDAWRHGRARIVRPVAGDVVGHPVVFDGSLLGELCAVDAQRGGSAVIAAHATEVALIAIDDARTVADVDTPADVGTPSGLARRRLRNGRAVRRT
jgi:molybdenum cofactor cytidylyltransferase